MEKFFFAIFGLGFFRPFEFILLFKNFFINFYFDIKFCRYVFSAKEPNRSAHGRTERSTEHERCKSTAERRPSEHFQLNYFLIYGMN